MKTTGLILAAVALSSLGSPQAATAQLPLPGTRVRVVDAVTLVPVMTGELVSTAGDTVIVKTLGQVPTPFVVGPQYQLQVSVGTHRKTGTGIGLGLLIGGAAGALIGLATYQECDGNCFDFGPGPNAVAGAVLGGLLGMVIGGTSGANTKSDRWQE